MLNGSEASRGVAYLDARHAVARAPLAGFLSLILCWTWSWFRPEGVGGFLALLAGLLGGPWVLARLLPRRNWAGFRFSQAAYILNGLLLASLGYREVAGLDLPFLEPFPLLSTLLPWSAVILSSLYFLLQFQGWKERVLATASLRERLAHPPEAPLLEALEALVEALLRPCPGMAWAEFRTVPPSLKAGRRFLRLDTERHSLWRVALQPGYALLVSRRDGRMEVVEQGGLRIVAEDPAPGARQVLCLVRWNEHLVEGRIGPAHFETLRDWNRAKA